MKNKKKKFWGVYYSNQKLNKQIKINLKKVSKENSFFLSTTVKDWLDN